MKKYNFILNNNQDNLSIDEAFLLILKNAEGKKLYLPPKILKKTEL
jgi:hypothetical protein